jgi:hypothetical protein
VVDLRVRLLGGLVVEGLSAPEIGSRKARSLLAALAVARGAPVGVDVLAEVVQHLAAAPTGSVDDGAKDATVASLDGLARLEAWRLTARLASAAGRTDLWATAERYAELRQGTTGRGEPHRLGPDLRGPRVGGPPELRDRRLDCALHCMRVVLGVGGGEHHTTGSQPPFRRRRRGRARRRARWAMPRRARRPGAGRRAPVRPARWRRWPSRRH